MIAVARTVWRSAILLCFASLALGAPASAQFESKKAFINPTKLQKESLEVYVQAVVDLSTPYIAGVERAQVERQVRKAIQNRLSYRAIENLRMAFVKLLAVDLDVESSKRGWEIVEGALLNDFLEKVTKDSGARILFDDVRAPRTHYLVLLHKQPTLAWMRELHQEPLDTDQRRGAKDLAKYYSESLCALYESEVKPAKFKSFLEEAFATVDTDRALLATRHKLHLLLRPYVRRELYAPGIAQTVAAEKDVARLVAERFTEELELRLREDHEQLIHVPKDFRRRLRERVKSEKEAAK